MRPLITIATVVAIIVAGCGGNQQTEAIVTPVSTTALKFFSLNIASGAGAQWNTPATRAQQAAFIAAQNPDVVGMQEVDVGVARSGGGNTAAAAVGALAQRGTVIAAKCAAVDGNGNYTPGGPGQVGVGAWVSSALTVTDYWTVDLDFTDVSRGGDGWPRCSLLVAAQTPLGHPFVFAVAHLETGDRYAAQVVGDRAREVQETLADGPDVLLGDMNALGQEIKAAAPPQYRLCGPQQDAPGFTEPQYGWIDQVWASTTCSGNLVPTHQVASDHAYAAAATVNL